jgi:glycerate dehydrogenase
MEFSPFGTRNRGLSTGFRGLEAPLDRSALLNLFLNNAINIPLKSEISFVAIIPKDYKIYATVAQCFAAPLSLANIGFVQINGFDPNPSEKCSRFRYVADLGITLRSEMPAKDSPKDRLHLRLMERIVFLERNTFTVEFRRPRFDHEWIEHGETLPEQIVERLRDATIAICNKLPLREPELSRLPQLKLIAVAATGVDNVDLDYCKSNGIAVCNTRNYARHSLPEHVLMLMLALRRNLFRYTQDVKAGKWQQAKQFCLLDHTIRDLHGSTLGVVGYGFLGQGVAALAQCVGMEVLLAERKNATRIREGRVSFGEVLQRSDAVTLHCPLNEDTRNLIAEKEFQAMKRSALLINTARGGLVNEAELIRALQEGVIAGAAFDVLSREPPSAGNILLDAVLPNLIVTPHVAWASREAMQTLADQLVDNIEAFIRGEPRNLVT